VNGATPSSNLAGATSRPVDPWSTVISQLVVSSAPGARVVDRPTLVRRKRCDKAVSASCSGGRATAATRARPPASPSRSTIVKFVERFSAKSVSITWRDATAANYSEQLWIRRIARSQGVCAITGAAIVRGDAVYGPAGRTAVRPANGSQMVLAEALEALE
jgi:hypothetical protein